MDSGSAVVGFEWKAVRRTLQIDRAYWISTVMRSAVTPAHYYQYYY